MYSLIPRLPVTGQPGEKKSPALRPKQEWLRPPPLAAAPAGVPPSRRPPAAAAGHCMSHGCHDLNNGLTYVYHHSNPISIHDSFNSDFGRLLHLSLRNSEFEPPEGSNFRLWEREGSRNFWPVRPVHAFCPTLPAKIRANARTLEKRRAKSRKLRAARNLSVTYKISRISESPSDTNHKSQ